MQAYFGSVQIFVVTLLTGEVCERDQQVYTAVTASHSMPQESTLLPVTNSASNSANWFPRSHGFQGEAATSVWGVLQSFFATVLFYVVFNYLEIPSQDALSRPPCYCPWTCGLLLHRVFIRASLHLKEHLLEPFFHQRLLRFGEMTKVIGSWIAPGGGLTHVCSNFHTVSPRWGSRGSQSHCLPPSFFRFFSP